MREVADKAAEAKHSSMGRNWCPERDAAMFCL